MIKKEDIKYRVGNIGKNKQTSEITGVTFLIYIDARTAYDELDALYKDQWGFNWEYIPNENGVKGTLTVGSRSFSDVGYPSASKIEAGETKGEWMKDAVSDAVKRCAVQLGIGRELYDAPFLYLKADMLNLDQTGKYMQKRSNTDGEYSDISTEGRQMIEDNIDKWYNKLDKPKL